MNFKLPFKPRVFWPALIAAVIVGGALTWFFITHFGSKDYAREVALPLEAALIKAGGIKKCASGDDGRSWSNVTPHYGSDFELHVPREEAMATITRIASENGYNLQHASLANRGPIPAADEYIDDWFYDVDRLSPYKDLRDGNIRLFVMVDNSGPRSLSHLACGTKEPVRVDSGKDKSAIAIEVSLPDVRR